LIKGKDEIKDLKNKNKNLVMELDSVKAKNKEDLLIFNENEKE
jgi:hypothetical protein